MFSKRLKEIRLKSGLTQREIADFLHISPQSISKWENGEATPSIEFLPLLARLFGCSADDFFKEDTASCVNVTDLKKFAEFNRVFLMDKSDPEYVDPIFYLKENSGWEDNCLSLFNSMKDERCFTVNALQSRQGCDYETALEICKTLEDIGCLTKAPDSKYYITNAENMGSFIFMVKTAKLLANIDEFKGKNNLELDDLLIKLFGK